MRGQGFQVSGSPYGTLGCTHSGRFSIWSKRITVCYKCQRGVGASVMTEPSSWRAPGAVLAVVAMARCSSERGLVNDGGGDAARGEPHAAASPDCDLVSGGGRRGLQEDEKRAAWGRTEGRTTPRTSICRSCEIRLWWSRARWRTV